MDLKLTGFKRADFPAQGNYAISSALVLIKGPDVYCGAKPGDSVNLVFDDETVAVTASQVAIGPLLNFFPSAMMAAPAHFAMKPGLDGRAIVDALAKMYPGDAAAVDPRTIYSSAVVSLPPAVAPAAATTTAPAAAA